MRARMIAVGMLSLAVGLSGVVAATPAAAADKPDCETRFICMWEDAEFGGDKWVQYERVSGLRQEVEIDGWDGDNEISSIANFTGCNLSVRQNDHDSYGLSTFFRAGETEIPNLERVEYIRDGVRKNWNDDIESFILYCPN